MTHSFDVADACSPGFIPSLPREAFFEIMLVLRAALPPPLEGGEAGEARRDRAAMAGVAALRPETGAEGRLAAQFVAADAWAMDCLRLAQERRREAEIARKCRAQAMSLMREGKSALRLLLRLQAARQALLKNEAEGDRAAWAEHAALGRMAEALAPAAEEPDRTEAAATGPDPTDDPMPVPLGGMGRLFRAAIKNGQNPDEMPCETGAGFQPQPPARHRTPSPAG